MGARGRTGGEVTGDLPAPDGPRNLPEHWQKHHGVTASETTKIKTRAVETVEKQTTVFPRFPQPLLLLDKAKSVKDVLITICKACLDNKHTEGHPYGHMTNRITIRCSFAGYRFSESLSL